MKSSTIKNVICFSLLLLFSTCPIFGQAKKLAKLTVADYGKWCSLEGLQISDNGKWISYKKHYDSNLDTIVLQRISDKKQILIDRSIDGKFGGAKWFGCRKEGNDFELINLDNSKRILEKNVDRFAFSEEGAVLFLYGTGKAGNFIAMKQLNKVFETKIDSTNDSSTSGSSVAWSGGSNQKYVALKDVASGKPTDTITKSSTESFRNMAWNANGEYLTFTGTSEKSPNDITLYRYARNSKQLESYTLKVPERMRFGTEPLLVSNDGKRVFFRLNQMAEVDSTAGSVQIWNAADKQVFAMRRTNDFKKIGRYAVWFPELKEFKLLTQEGHSTALFIGNQNYIITYDTKPYEPSSSPVSDRDCYITDVSTGKSKFLVHLLGEQRNIYASPDGAYLFYFKDASWWSYHIQENLHANLSKSIHVSFADEDDDRPRGSAAYGILGVSKTGKTIFVYDKFDIWEVGFNGKSHKVVTKGRAKKLTLRCAEKFSSENEIEMFAKLPSIDIRKCLLHGISEDKTESGYFKFDAKGILSKIKYGEQWNYNLVKAKTSETIVLMVENSDMPTKIEMIKLNSGESEIVCQSNQHYLNYKLGRCERIVFKNRNGIETDGFLYFPADYDPGKIYPMVVEVYEKLKYPYHKYYLPTLYNLNGFNNAHYQNNGYFVFFPTTKFPDGELGYASLACVEDAVKAILPKYPIDKERVGLIGHSFGGYEAMFIATQSKLFATVVAGAGIADLTSFYLSLSVNNRVPEFFRMEKEQWRLKKTVFEIPEMYRLNSPITFAENVSVPVLTWTGADDKQLNPIQSMEFYMALRRLNKEHIMLVYPKEGHNIEIADNQADVTNKIMQWFGYYLKGEPRPKWTVPR